MKIVMKRSVLGALQALPDIFELQPSTDYQALISHSAAEVTHKAWNATGRQFHDAIDQTKKVRGHCQSLPAAQD